MSEDQHASVPGASGAALVKAKASIHLTRTQYYARIAGAFVVGAAVGVGAVFALQALRSEEPPIRVRPGSIDLELPTNTTKWEKEEENSVTWWQIKRRKKTPSRFDVLVATMAPDKCPKGPKASAAWVKITDSGGNWFKLDLERRRTSVTANDKDLVLLGDEVLTLKPGDYIAKMESDLGTICTFGQNEFVEADVR